MGISTGDILGHAQVGVYLSVVGDVLFYPTSLDKPAVDELASAFEKMEMYPCLIEVQLYSDHWFEGIPKGSQSLTSRLNLILMN